MSENQGYFRVVNVRGDDEDFRASKGERVIMMDRSNPTMGNRHFMKTQSREERERVIDAYQADLDADLGRKGPMHQTMMAIAFDILDRGDKVALQCFCAPKPCHLDLVATRIAQMVAEIRKEIQPAAAEPDSAGRPHKTSP